APLRQLRPNPFVAGTPATPLIAGLRGGAEAYGLLEGVTAADFTALTAAAPAAAVAAVVRLDRGPAAYGADYDHFDMLLFINLGNEELRTPMLGVAAAGSAASFVQDLRIGGLGPDVRLGVLNGHEVWATLIPDVAIELDATVGGPIGSVQGLQGRSLADGEVAYIEARPAEPTIAGLNALAVAGGQIYALSPTQDALLVVNSADFSVRQHFSDGTDAVTTLAGASAVAASADGANVYVASRDDATVSVFARDASGNLSFVHAIDPGAGLDVFDRIALQPGDGGQLVVAGPDAIVQFLRQTDGAGIGRLVAGKTEPLSGTSDLAYSSDGLLLYVACADELQLRSASDLAPASGQSGITGASVLGVAASSDGQHEQVYVAGAGGRLQVFQRTFGSTTLTLLQTLQENADGVRGLAGAADLLISADGTRLYVLTSGRASNTLTTFFRDPATGTLRFAQVLRGGPGLAAPAAIAQDAAGTVYVAAEHGFGTIPGGLAAFVPVNSAAPQAERFSVRFAGVESLALTTGGYDDAIHQIDPPLLTTLAIDAGDGFDRVDLLNLGAATTVDGGSGDDRISVRSDTAGALTLAVDCGAGDDELVVR
ncbi:MAG TPA: beta-propeller fold lactonase family protein, partial [Accumulibacter sp.]|uniref:beta-propeller fold lactonase family protein n=1 Tax=Accumulibacter sp. TaxID=2053492 RepID=UPI002B600791